jgi:hypothetical protein
MDYLTGLIMFLSYTLGASVVFLGATAVLLANSIRRENKLNADARWQDVLTARREGGSSK